MKYFQPLAIAFIAIFSLSLTTVAQADGAALYQSKTCWSCHGKDAKSPLLPIYPKLAGQNADYAFNQMMDIKSGVRANGQAVAMKGVMGLVSEDEMREIANWLASQ
ncbi:MAG: c-type cytochrome [Gammaproteobacteria bacterium]|nr:c-type cytochrome [Gammaproteobacteria bacterium]